MLLSLVGATTFWFFNELNKEFTTRLIYPLKFNFDRDSVVVMQPLPQTLKVDVTSGGWNLLRRTFILFNPSPISIDLNNPTLIRFYTRATLLPIVNDQLSELTINYVLTDTIYFNIEEKRSMLVPVAIDSSAIRLRENYRLVSPISANIDTVEIIGPKSLIDTLSTPYLIQIKDNRIDSDFDDQVEVSLSRPDVTLAIPDEISVQFEVDRFDRLTVPVTFDALNFPEDSSAFPAQNYFDVVFTVQRSRRQNNYVDTDFGITVDYNLFDKTDSTVIPILIYAPEEAIEIDTEPEFMKIVFSDR